MGTAPFDAPTELRRARLPERDTQAGLGFLRPILDEGGERNRFLPVDDAFRLVVTAYNPVAMLDFYADWCVSCKELEDPTLRDRRFRAALADVVLLRADVTANDEADRELMRRLGIFGPPAILFFAPDRSERRRYRRFGFEDADEFSLRVEGATDAA